MFFGSIPALVTPFSGNCVAEDSLSDLVEWQIAEGSNGLVPCGTTGESATMSAAEQRRVIELTVQVSKGRVPVIAGCGSNNGLASGSDFIQLSGNDETALAFNAGGGVGCISVTANIAPKLCSDFQKAMREGRWDEALKLQDRLYPLHTALFTDASPGPAKYALSRVRPGFPTELRLPLVEASAASKKAVDAALEHAGLI